MQTPTHNSPRRLTLAAILLWVPALAQTPPPPPQPATRAAIQPAMELVANVEIDAFDRTAQHVEAVIAREEKPVILFVFRDSSAPARLMLKVAWREPRVVEWGRTRGTILRATLADDDPRAAAWRVDRVPSILAFEKGVEVDRLTGYRTAVQVIEFLEGVEKHETSGVRLDRALAAIHDGSSTRTPRERLGLARDLLDASRLEDASAQYEWLWENLAKVDASMARVRVRAMTHSLRELCEGHGPSRDVFRAKRDAIEALLKDEATRTWPLLADWIALNGVLTEDGRSIAWFDRLKAFSDSPATLERFANQLEPLLEAMGEVRAGEAILLYARPEIKLRIEHDEMRAELEERAAQAAEPDGSGTTARELIEPQERFDRRMGFCYVALVRNGRAAQAEQFAEDCKTLAIDGRLILALVNVAIEQGLKDVRLAEMLDAAKRLGQETTEAEAKLRRMR